MTSVNKSDDFIKYIFNRKYQSVWIACTGPNQSGKTDFMLYLMERLHALGLMDGFGSNMPLETDFQVDFIEDFQTLKKTCQMINPDPERHGIKRYLFFASEMGNWAPQDMPWLNTQFIRELQQVRKYGLNFLGDGIGRIDKRILNEKHFHGYFQKLSKANPKIAVYNDYITRRKTTLYNIPRTSIKFNTWYSAMFYMEPQLKEGAIIPLNYEHEIAFKYLDLGSWKKVGVDTQTGKRCVLKVLRFHRHHCLYKIVEEKDVSLQIESEITKDSVEVTE